MPCLRQGHLFDLSSNKSATKDLSLQQKTKKEELREFFLKKINPELRDPRKVDKSKKDRDE
jgi:hypothetical protein